MEKRLKHRLNGIKTLPDLEQLIKMMNPLLKAERFSIEEHYVLRRLRQQAYDRRRNPKFQAKIKNDLPLDVMSPMQAPAEDKPTPKRIVPEPGATMLTTIAEKITPPQQKADNFGEGALRALTSINGERFVKTAPALLAWLSSASIVSYFLWQQSVDLYDSAGFKDSLWAAAGGILMLVGFAAHHSITRSKLALLLCLYASGYEAYLMISGTVENEQQIQIQTIQINPDLVFLKEKAAKSLAYYHEVKQRYDNPESKVFKNAWFLKTNLNPAWQESLADHKEWVAKEAALAGETGSDHITWLKILYRLGLVFLCMILVHRFFAVWREPHEGRLFGN